MAPFQAPFQSYEITKGLYFDAQSVKFLNGLKGLIIIPGSYSKIRGTLIYLSFEEGPKSSTLEEISPALMTSVKVIWLWDVKRSYIYHRNC